MTSSLKYNRCLCLFLLLLSEDSVVMPSVFTVPSQAPNSQPNPSPSDMRRAYEALGISSPNPGAPGLLPPAAGGVNRPHRLTGITVGPLPPNSSAGPGGSVRVLPPPHPQGKYTCVVSPYFVMRFPTSVNDVKFRYIQNLIKTGNIFVQHSELMCLESCGNMIQQFCVKKSEFCLFCGLQ